MERTGAHSRELLLNDLSVLSVAPSGNANATLRPLGGLSEDSATEHVTVHLVVQTTDHLCMSPKVTLLNLLSSGARFSRAVVGSVTVLQDGIACKVSMVILVADGWVDPGTADPGGGPELMV